MYVSSFIHLLESMDSEESKNLSVKLGFPYSNILILSRGNKLRRTECTAYVEIDGKIVLASQPKKAKRK